MTNRLPSVCPECGTVFYRIRDSAYCTECKPTDDSYLYRTQTTAQAGYDERWNRLSRRARALQPFCSDCGSPEDLTADHTTRAWKRRAAGKTIRLKDIDVVCRACNSERGAARGDKISERRAIVEAELDAMRAGAETESDLFHSD